MDHANLILICYNEDDLGRKIPSQVILLSFFYNASKKYQEAGLQDKEMSN